MKPSWIIFLLLILPFNSWGALFRAESETFNSFRKNEKSNFEAPLYEVVSASLLTDKKDIEINSNFSLMTDLATADKNKFHLYIFDIRYDLIPESLSLTVGRSLDLKNSIGVASLDAVTLEYYLFEKQVRVGAFAGVERKLENFGVNLSSDVLGLKADYHSDDPQALFLTTKFIQRKNSNNSLENLFQFSGKKAFTTVWNPEVLIDSESDLNASNLNRFEAGFDFYPSILTFAKIRFLTYNVLPQTGVEQPIFTIFSTGPLNEIRYQVEQKISSSVIVGLSVFNDEYQLFENQRASGNGVEVEVKYFDDANFKLNNAIYYFESYGGKVIGHRFEVANEFFNKNEFFLAMDDAYYEKITSSKRAAVAGELGWSQELANRFKITVSGQVSSNNLLKDDFRTFAKLTYLIWDEI